MNELERKERIAHAEWVAEVMADPRFQAAVQRTKDELQSGVEQAEKALLDATLKHRPWRFWQRLKPKVEAVQRMRQASNVLDLVLLHLQYIKEDGTIQKHITSQMR